MESPGDPHRIQVTAAVIQGEDGRVLIARRRDGVFAGLWEFPGGKVEPGESREACLERELKEELGIEARAGEFFCASRHDYGHLAVELFTYRVSSYRGQVVPLEHAELRWVDPGDLSLYDFPEADLPIVRKLVEGR